jgi:hypothetical protein
MLFALVFMALMASVVPAYGNSSLTNKQSTLAKIDQAFYKEHPWVYIENKFIDQRSENLPLILKLIVWYFTTMLGATGGLALSALTGANDNYGAVTVAIGGLSGLATGIYLTQVDNGKEYDIETLRIFLNCYDPDFSKENNSKCLIPPSLYPSFDALHEEYLKAGSICLENEGRALLEKVREVIRRNNPSKYYKPETNVVVVAY